MNYHHKLGDSLQDQLCMASIFYIREHFDESIEIYKKIL